MRKSIGSKRDGSFSSSEPQYFLNEVRRVMPTTSPVGSLYEQINVSFAISSTTVPYKGIVRLFTTVSTGAVGLLLLQNDLLRVRPINVDKHIRRGPPLGLWQEADNDNVSGHGTIARYNVLVREP